MKKFFLLIFLCACSRGEFNISQPRQGAFHLKYIGITIDGSLFADKNDLYLCSWSGYDKFYHNSAKSFKLVTFEDRNEIYKTLNKRIEEVGSKGYVDWKAETRQYILVMPDKDYNEIYSLKEIR